MMQRMIAMGSGGEVVKKTEFTLTNAVFTGNPAVSMVIKGYDTLYFTATANNSVGGCIISDPDGNVLYIFTTGTHSNKELDISAYEYVTIGHQGGSSHTCTFSNLKAE